MIHVVSTADSNYAAPIAAMFCSLLSNFRGDYAQLRLYVLDGGLTDEDKQGLERVAAPYAVPIGYWKPSETLFAGFRLNYHITNYAAYYRLLVGELAPDSAEKLLYLDPDMIVLDSIDQLYRRPLNDCAFAAVPNLAFDRHHQLGLHSNSDYFNAGLLLINLSVWRREQIGQRALTFIRDNPDAVELLDQDGLNAVSEGRWQPLGLRWNMQEALYLSKTLAWRADFTTALDSPAIVHFTGSSKPWHYLCIHPQKSRYFDYLAQTPWRGRREDGVTLLNVLRKARLLWRTGRSLTLLRPI